MPPSVPPQAVAPASASARALSLPSCQETQVGYQVQTEGQDTGIERLGERRLGDVFGCNEDGLRIIVFGVGSTLSSQSATKSNN